MNQSTYITHISVELEKFNIEFEKKRAEALEQKSKIQFFKLIPVKFNQFKNRVLTFN